MVGRELGLSVGSDDGAVVGRDEGCVVGRDDGEVVGMPLGAVVGTVGAWTGEDEGTAGHKREAVSSVETVLLVP